MAAPPDYYEVLQVSPNADVEIIQAVYKRLAYKWHPDRRPGDPSATEQMILLNEAYEVLSDPQKRREYDLRRSQSATNGVAAEAAQQAAEQRKRAETERKRKEKRQRKEAEWHVMHAGKELGPLSLVELREKVVAGEIEADDLVKKAADLWIKARNSAYLQDQFLRKRSRDEASLATFDKFGCFYLAIVGCVLLVLVGVPVMLAIFMANNPNPTSAQIKDDHFYWERGNAWRDKLDYDQAIQDYTEAIRLAPKDAAYYSSRGYAWEEKNNYDKAIQDYSEAIRLAPNDSSAFFKRGDAWSKKKDYDQAIRDFTEAIRLDPQFELAISGRLLALSLKKGQQQ